MLNKIKNRGLKEFVAVAIFSIAFSSILFFPSASNAAYNAPTVQTKSATNINSENATLNSFVNGNGYSTRVWFEWSRTTNFSKATSQNSIGPGSENYQERVTGLLSNATYYFRVVAQNAEGKIYGNILSFRTNSDLSINYYYPTNYQSYPNYYDPTNYPDYNNYDYQNYSNATKNSESLIALTNTATGVGNTTAQLNALITSNMNTSSNAWFEWGTTPSLGNKTLLLSIGSLPAIKHVNTLSGLSPGTAYYFRAVAENSYQRNNGSILSFVTGGSKVTQNTIIHTPDPAPTPAPITPAPVKETTPTETKAKAVSTLGASLAETNSFFPDTLIGWLLIIIFILLLLFLVKHLYRDQFPNQKHDSEHK